MKANKILHTLSHLKWVFLAAIILLILYSFIFRPENLISIIGLIIFLAGIQLGLESLGDVEKMSAREKKRFEDPSVPKFISRIIVFMIVILIAISTLFISLRFIFPSNNELFNDFFNLGLDCWALILGLLCQLKSAMDKHQHAIALS